MEDYMKRISKILSGTLCAVMLSSGIAMAETTFTPLNFDDSPAITTTKSTKTTATAEPKGTDLLEPSQITGGLKMQDSIVDIDKAQVELRNRLLNYRTEYSEIDSRYNSTKAERKNAKKKIKCAEKKIKNLDNAKKKIRKNFERKINI